MIFRTSIYGITVIALTIFGVSHSAVAQDKQTESRPTSDLLVDVQWLSVHQNEVRLITLGQTDQQYRAGHLPNAVFVDWKTQISDPAQKDLFNLPPKEMVEKLLSRLGVTPTTTIVLADNRSNRISTRLLWTLKMHGHWNVKILDGGIKAWRLAGKELTTAIISIEPTVYEFGADDNAWADANFADTSAVEHSIANGRLLLDGRPKPQYTGAEPGVAFHTNQPHQRRGHIQSAINVPWKLNFNEDGKFKSVEALRAIYTQAGVTPDQHITTYCNEGLHAAPAWFVLKELLGYPNVTLYDDSMGVWANRFDTPMEQTEALLD